jgi:hypothetical protein
MLNRNEEEGAARLVLDGRNGLRLVIVEGTSSRLSVRLAMLLVGALMAATAFLGSPGAQQEAVAAVPLSTMTTPEGVTINLYVSTVTPQQVYSLLLAAGLQSQVKLTRVDIVDTGMSMSTYGGSCNADLSSCWAYNGAIQLTDENVLSTTANYSFAHEYGHVWSNYYRWTYWKGSWDAYLQARGLLGDARLNSTKCWQPAELIAEDYRQLFGAAEARTKSLCVKDIPAANQVPGLRDFLGLTWTNGAPPPGYSNVIPSPTPSATATSSPTATPTRTSTPVATSTASSPSPTKTPTAGKGNNGKRGR